MLPALGFSSDTGLSLGVAAIATRLGPEMEPFYWRLSGQLSASFKIEPDGRVVVPLTDNYLRFDVPGRRGLRLRGDLSLYGQQCGWYGLGNHSPGGAPADTDWRYGRTWPTLRLELWKDVWRSLRLFGGTSGSYSHLEIPEGTRLAADVAGGGGEAVSSSLHGTEDHGVVEGFVGVMADSRDDEFWPTRGQLHDASLRGGVVSTGDVYVGGDLTLRGYVPLGTPHVVLAGQIVGDVLGGAPPFYELARHGGAFPAFSPGGQFGPRGVPLQRYHGAVKVLAALELRTMLVPFHVVGIDWELGPLAFVDAGRVWARLVPTPELDGTGLGLHVGAGGGLRLRMGESVVVRGDFGWSPDGIGVYFDLGNTF